MEGRLKEMRNWQHWSNNQLRDELITQIEALPASGQHPDAITAALAKGDEVRLMGFGSFAVAHRAASEGRNPRTGESVHIPERRVPHFKPGKALREAVGAQPVDSDERTPDA